MKVILIIGLMNLFKINLRSLFCFAKTRSPSWGSAFPEKTRSPSWGSAFPAFILFLLSFASSADDSGEKYNLRVSQKENKIVLNLFTNLDTESSLWVWDKKKKIYIDNKIKEKNLYIFFKSADSAIIDLWVLRKDRSINSCFLDDCYLTFDKLGNIKYMTDAGSASWKIKYFANFAGNEIPKYYIQKGEGSIIDVSIKKNKNELILKRDLLTNDNDDINFSNFNKINIAITEKLPKNIKELKFNKIDKFIQK